MKGRPHCSSRMTPILMAGRSSTIPKTEYSNKPFKIKKTSSMQKEDMAKLRNGPQVARGLFITIFLLKVFYPPLTVKSSFIFTA